MSQRIDYLNTNPFLIGPAILVTALRNRLLAVAQFASLFGDAIDSYKRSDYAIRNFPALRIYNESFTKEFDSWFVTGELILDVILPPALRRNLIQDVQDTIASALLQQFRRPTFFDLLCADIPGLNELGKSFSVTKGLQFTYENEYCPVLQMQVNFKIDLRAWDNYLEEEYLTKDEPFAATLTDLKSILFNTVALDDKAATGYTDTIEVIYP